MLLYRKKDKSIVIYMFQPIESKIIEYKTEQMNLIPENKQVVQAKLKFETDLSKLNLLHDNSYIDELSFSDDCQNNEKILQAYFQNTSSSYKTLRFQDETRIMYCLIFCRHENLNNTTLDIIHLPRSLYILQLLLNGEYDLVVNKNILEQLDLFKVNKNILEQLELFEVKELEEVSIDELEKIVSYNIMPVSYYIEALKKCEKDKEFVKVIRSKKNYTR